jgi:hypothetical protein
MAVEEKSIFEELAPYAKMVVVPEALALAERAEAVDRRALQRGSLAWRKDEVGV